MSEAMPMTFELTQTEETCFQCRGRLWRLEPDYHGWRYYCPTCQHATSTIAELDTAGRAAAAEGALGVVCAVPLHLEIMPKKI